jgi:hypothetical protein
MTITDDYIDSWPDGIRIELPDPAYDGWFIDLYVVHRAADDGRTHLAFVAFQCVDMDEQVRVLEGVIDNGFTGLKDCGPSEAQAEQVIEMFRRTPGMNVIEGIIDRDDDGHLCFHPTRAGILK